MGLYSTECLVSAQIRSNSSTCLRFPDFSKLRTSDGRRLHLRYRCYTLSAGWMQWQIVCYRLRIPLCFRLNETMVFLNSKPSLLSEEFESTLTETEVSSGRDWVEQVEDFVMHGSRLDRFRLVQEYLLVNREVNRQWTGGGEVRAVWITGLDRCEVLKHQWIDRDRVHAEATESVGSSVGRARTIHEIEVVLLQRGTQRARRATRFKGIGTKNGKAWWSVTTRNLVPTTLSYNVCSLAMFSLSQFLPRPMSMLSMS